MIGMLYQSVYILVIGIFVLNFVVAEIICFIGWGDSKIIAPIGGAAFAFLFLKITKLHFAWPIIILSCIVTAVLSIFVLSHLSDFIIDKLDDFFDKDKKDED